MSEHSADVGARIVDRGYQHYAGKHRGAIYVFRSMVWATIQRGLGLRRSARMKLLPWLLIAAVYVPTIVLLALRVILPIRSLQVVPYATLYSSLTLIYVLFSGLLTPDLLCLDRRERVLSLYFAAPIMRWHYIAAQAAGLMLLLLALTLVPMLLLFAGSALLAPSVATYVHDHLGDLWHIVLSGGLLAGYYAALALLIAAFTDRRAYAAGAYLGLLLVSATASTILWRGMRFSGHEKLALLDLLTMPVHVVRWLFGLAAEPFGDNGWPYVGAALGVIVVSLAVVAWRYQRVRD